MKFTVKGLIALFVTSSALFLTPMRSDAQVNMKTLAEVAKSCHKDVPSKEYYQQMLLNFNSDLNECIRSRYHYSLILDEFPELASTGEILPGYPGSVAVGQIASIFHSDGRWHLLDCIIANDTSSDACWQSKKKISEGGEYRYHFRANTNRISYYLPYICPSCVVAHDEVSGSGEVILKAFMEWFMKLDKSQRREVISLLGDDDKARQLRELINDESEAAVKEYREARARVQQQEQERRRRELLGN
ncbi:hypothetical protein [Anabaena lutea]|uniref:Secreted protein n=1 Tax=Anabaena lutea FACHB-196 TaxID=2692881 RepID=A0ABR8FBI4_9NOST|nr:hypothetical protein [Anabaena lutea]MBD2567225.1 hypothetical protein [Anabaena lutea FACHB-196]